MTRLQWLSWCTLRNLGEWGRDHDMRSDFHRWRREFLWNLQKKDRANDTALALSA